MTLTKKHFEDIAGILSKNLFGNNLKPSCFEYLIKDFCDYFYSQNPKFDCQKFREACLKSPFSEEANP